MGLDVKIEDPLTGKGVHVLNGGGMLVYAMPPPVEELTAKQLTRRKVWSGRLTTAAGSADLTVDGSITPVVFYLGASDDDEVRFISEIRLILHSTLMDMDKATESRRFGPAAAAPGLPNGLVLEVVQGGAVTSLFLDPVSTILDFQRYAGLDSRSIVNILDGVATGTDYLQVAITLPCVMGIPAGSEDVVRLTVSDDLTLLTLFEVQVLGCRELLL